MVIVTSATDDIHRVCSNMEGDGSTQKQMDMLSGQLLCWTLGLISGNNQMAHQSTDISRALPWSASLKFGKFHN